MFLHIKLKYAYVCVCVCVYLYDIIQPLSMFDKSAAEGTGPITCSYYSMLLKNSFDHKHFHRDWCVQYPVTTKYFRKYLLYFHLFFSLGARFRHDFVNALKNVQTFYCLIRYHKKVLYYV